MPRKPSDQTRSVLEALAQEPGRWHYGYDLLQVTGLKSGSLYPILARLADRAWLEATWEEDPPLGRPRRHLYRLTDEGAEAARATPTVPARSVRGGRLATGTP
jgi:PadR family transcriptional regulator PadR